MADDEPPRVPMGADPLLPHKQRLLQRRRCPHCAEPVKPMALLRADPCPSCGRPLGLEEDHVQGLLMALRERWSRYRAIVYGAVLVGFFFAGLIPLLPALLSAVSLPIANLVLIRQPSRWLPIGVRATTRLLILMWLLFLVTVSMAANAVAALLLMFFGLGAFVSSITGLLTTMLYIEGSLWLIERAVRLSADLSPTAMRASLLVPIGAMTMLGATAGATLWLSWAAVAPLLGAA